MEDFHTSIITIDRQFRESKNWKNYISEFQPNLSFIINTAPARHNVTALAMITGHEPIKIPYNNQNATPQVNAMYMPSDMSCVCRDFHTCQTWGMKETVVRVAARLPIKSVNCIL